MNEALALLVLVWAALFVPGAVRSRNASPHATVGGFERAMDVLRSETRSSSGRELLVPADAGRIVGREIDATDPQPLRHEDPVIERRRVWFLRLAAATLLTVLLAVVVGGWMWVPALLSVAVSGGYVALLRRLKLQRDEARRVVRDLDLGAARHDVQRRLPAAVGDERWGSATVRLRRWDD